MKEMYRKNKIKAVIAIAVALAFIMPITAVASVGTIGVTSNIENTNDVEIMVESTNSDNSDNTEYTIVTAETVNTAMPLTGNIIYVGGSGTGNYTTIQLGINAAQVGDTVYVYDGLYNELITITKQLDLIGESRENTIIDGGGPSWKHVVAVKASGVNISNFTVQGLQGYAISYGYSSGLTGGTINNCNVTSRKDGIWLYKAVGTSVINCNIIGSTDDRENGLKIQWSDGNYIEGCNIYNSEKSGIYFDQNSDGNIITNCNMYGNGWNGILIDGSPYYSPLNNEITGCNVFNNDDCGISIKYALTCTLDNNAMYGNPYNFAIVGSMTSHYNHAIGPLNTVNGEPMYWLYQEVGTTYDGIDFGFLGMISCTDVTVMNADTYGILLVGTTGSTISNVNSHDAEYGIDLQWDSNNNDVTDCNFYNSEDGINLYYSSYNEFTNCKAYDFEITGFSVSRNSDYNTFTNCNASGSPWGMGFNVFMSSENTFINCHAYELSTGFYISNSYGGVIVNNSIIDCYAYSNNDGIAITCGSSYACAAKTTVTGCNIYDNGDDGIYLWSLSDNIITNNNIHDNNCGIHIRESPNNVLENNILNGNDYGFYMQASTDVGDFIQYIDATNLIDGKRIYYLVDHSGDILDGSKNVGYLALIDCTNILVTDADVCGILLVNTAGSTISNVDSHSSVTGIYFHTSSNNIIVNCDVYDNEDHGIRLRNSPTNDFINCNTYNNGDYGIFFEYSSNNNNIESCSSYNNGKYGIYLWGSLGTTITDSNIYDNSGYGIYAYSTSCPDNVITNCNVYHNNNRGIYLKSEGNIITDCNIYDNTRNGIYLYYGNNNIYHNNLANNNPNAYAKKTTDTWDDGVGEGNYWSDYIGVDVAPKDGIGDTPYVSGNVNDRYPLMLPWNGGIPPPVIEDVALTTSDPLDTEPGFGWEKVTCTVIDFEVDKVKLVVTNPDSITTEYPMIKIGYKYYSCEITLTDAGDYTYHTWANDTSGLVAVPTPPETFLLPENWDMNDDRFCDISDLRKVALQFGATGTPGWIRADYNNDGICDISDLRKVALCFGDTY